MSTFIADGLLLVIIFTNLLNFMEINEDHKNREKQITTHDKSQGSSFDISFETQKRKTIPLRPPGILKHSFPILLVPEEGPLNVASTDFASHADT